MNNIKMIRFPRILGDHPAWEAYMAAINANNQAQLFAEVCRPIYWAVYWYITPWCHPDE